MGSAVPGRYGMVWWYGTVYRSSGTSILGHHTLASGRSLRDMTWYHYYHMVVAMHNLLSDLALAISLVSFHWKTPF